MATNSSESDNRERDTSNEPTTGGANVMVNGLLCSILRALSRTPILEELMDLIERDCEVDDIVEARKVLFTFYNDVMCTERNKRILDIDRRSKRGYVKDVVDQLIKVEKSTDAKAFCMPYDYNTKYFVSESERVTKTTENQISNEFDLKIEALEKRMNEKHRALHDAILDSVNKAINQSKLLL